MAHSAIPKGPTGASPLLGVERSQSRLNRVVISTALDATASDQSRAASGCL